jgi:hypothetical protein
MGGVSIHTGPFHTGPVVNLKMTESPPGTGIEDKKNDNLRLIDISLGSYRIKRSRQGLDGASFLPLIFVGNKPSTIPLKASGLFFFYV